MLLIDVETQARKLSTSDKEQLLRDLQDWLKEEAEPAPDLMAGTKYEQGWDFEEAVQAAEKLQTIIDNAPDPKPIEWDRMTLVKV
jgi:hypothetical protein